MAWRSAQLPTLVRDAAYDAYAQGARLRTAGWTVERVQVEGIANMLVQIPPDADHRAVVEAAFWDGFRGTVDPSAVKRE